MELERLSAERAFREILTIVVRDEKVSRERKTCSAILMIQIGEQGTIISAEKKDTDAKNQLT